MRYKNQINSNFLPQHLKVFAPKKEKNVPGFFRAVVPELKGASDGVIKAYLRSLTIEELMFVAESCRFPKNASQQDMSMYPESVQNCLKSSKGFLLFKGQLEILFVLAGGAREEAVRFRRKWNQKLMAVRDGLASEMFIGQYTLKDIIEALAYDTENYFVISEDLDFVQQVRHYVEFDEQEGKGLLSSSLSYINYHGDVSGERRSDIWQKTRTHINLKSLDENNFWVSFMIIKDNIQHEFHYNLLGEEMIQGDIYFMNPTFFQNSGSGKFIFTSTIVWVLDDECEHFEFAARFRGELPEYVKVVEMI